MWGNPVAAVHHMYIPLYIWIICHDKKLLFSEGVQKRGGVVYLHKPFRLFVFRNLWEKKRRRNFYKPVIRCIWCESDLSVCLFEIIQMNKSKKEFGAVMMR